MLVEPRATLQQYLVQISMQKFITLFSYIKSSICLFYLKSFYRVVGAEITFWQWNIICPPNLNLTLIFPVANQSKFNTLWFSGVLNWTQRKSDFLLVTANTKVRTNELLWLRFHEIKKAISPQRMWEHWAVYLDEIHASFRHGPLPKTLQNGEALFDSLTLWSHCEDMIFELKGKMACENLFRQEEIRCKAVQFQVRIIPPPEIERTTGRSWSPRRQIHSRTNVCMQQ